MVTAVELEQVLLQLSLPDNRSIQQATVQLKTAFTSPNIVAALIEVLSRSTNPTVRQYGAILLRRRIVKQWKKLDPNIKKGLKISLLDILASESEHLVRMASCQVISSIAKQEFKENGWPEVMQYIGNAVQSPDIKQKEIGYLLLSCICETSGETLKSFYAELFPVFDKGLTDKDSRKAAFYSIKGITHLVPFLGSDEEPMVKALIPKALDVIKELLQEDEDKACEALDLFDELVEIEIGIIIPYVKTLVEICLQIAQCSDYGDTLRVKALYLVCWACRRKAKALLKSQLLGPLLEILLSIMSLVEHSDASEDESSQDEDAEEEMEGSSLPSVAAQALDLLALHLPPGKFIPQVMLLIQRFLASTSQYHRKAAFIALGVLAEGCADYIKSRHLREALATVSGGLSDKSHLVSNAALFTLGQFAEHLQPDISTFHGEIVPVLLVHLQNTLNTADAKQKTTLTRIYYALESICENLEKDILPYLEQLVKTFLSTIEANKGIYATELAVSAIGSLANSAKESLLPYFPIIMEHLKVFLKEPATLETSSLQAQAVDTLGALARNIGENNFRCVAHDCMQLGLALLQNSDDPDIRRCTYALFSSLSIVLKADMEQYLNIIIPKMLESLRSTEGIMAQFCEREPAFLLDDDLDEECTGEGDDDDDDDVEGYTVENAYLEEKEDTCNALSELAEQTGSVFLPYIEECFKEVFYLVDESHVNLRKASITSCATFCKMLQQVLQENGAADFTPVLSLISQALPSALDMINKDTDRNGVMAAIDAVTEILRAFRVIRLQSADFIQSIANAANNVLMEKTPCQQCGEEESFTTDDEESQAELDAMLVEKMGDLLPLLAQAVGGEVFKPYFAAFLPQLVKRTRKTCAVSERSFAVGTIAEVIQAMEKHISEFVPQLAQLLLETLKDADEEVVSNSAFALGVLAESGVEATLPYYSNILQALFSASGTKATALVTDNVSGAVARLIMANGSAVPLDQVLPVLMQNLPIKDDKRENETVMRCLSMLYQSGNQIILAQSGQLLLHLLQSLINPDSGLSVGTKLAVKQVLVDIQRKYPDDFQSVLGTQGVSGDILEIV